MKPDDRAGRQIRRNERERRGSEDQQLRDSSSHAKVAGPAIKRRFLSR